MIAKGNLKIARCSIILLLLCHVIAAGQSPQLVEVGGYRLDPSLLFRSEERKQVSFRSEGVGDVLPESRLIRCCRSYFHLP